MNSTLRDTFAEFLHVSCGDVIRDLAEALQTPLQIVDPNGEVLLATDDVDLPEEEAAGTGWTRDWAVIEANGEILGNLMAATGDTRFQPLLFSLAGQIGRFFAAEHDLDKMTDQVSQSYDEINLLYRFSHALQPDDSFSATARKLLEETAELLEQRLLILCQPDNDHVEWTAGPGAQFPEKMHWLTDSRDALESIHVEFNRRWRGKRATSASRHPGSIDTPRGRVHYVISPVLVQATVTGYVGIFRTDEELPIETGELRLLECLVEELSNVATTRQLYQELREMLFSTVKSLVAAIDAKDQYTRGHSERVYGLSVRIGERIGLSADEMQTLSWAALLHDIGKIAITGKILNKPGRLTEEEFGEVKMHPERGCKVLEPIPQLRDTLSAIRHHHERFDGGGYPDGLKGEEIPLLARILSIADTFDAMYSSRAYRRALPQEAVLKEIHDCAGTQFDPRLAEVFLQLAAEGKIDDIHPSEDVDEKAA